MSKSTDMRKILENMKMTHKQVNESHFNEESTVQDVLDLPLFDLIDDPDDEGFYPFDTSEYVGELISLRDKMQPYSNQPLREYYVIEFDQLSEASQMVGPEEMEEIFDKQLGLVELLIDELQKPKDFTDQNMPGNRRTRASRT